jgi:ubiquinone/menaquinone biosynthesis C-methylase UbiE
MSRQRTVLARVMQRVFAWGTAHSTGLMQKHYGERKQRLFSQVAGTVIEIGPGAGINFAYYPRGTRVIAVEPNPYMHRYLRQNAQACGHQLEIIDSSAEAMPLPDAAAPFVVSTLVLCSVAEPARALREIKRVLTAPGRFLFIEHVAAPEGTRIRRRQERMVRPWRFVGDGCHPNRDTARVIQATGFSRVDMDCFSIPVPFGIVSPHIVGVAER